MWQNVHFWLFGGGGGAGWPINNQTGPILPPYKIWKQSDDKDFLSYRENDEISADAA